MPYRTRDVFLTALAPLSWGATYLVTTEFLPAGRPLLSGCLRALPAGLVLSMVTRTCPGELVVESRHPRPSQHRRILRTPFRRRLPTARRGCGRGRSNPATHRRRSCRGPPARTTATHHLGRSVDWDSWRCRARDEKHRGVGRARFGIRVWRCGRDGDRSGTTKHWGRPVQLLAFTSWQLIAGGLFLLPIVVLLEGAPPPLTTRNIVGYLWLMTIGTALAYSLWFRGIGLLPVVANERVGSTQPNSRRPPRMDRGRRAIERGTNNRCTYGYCRSRGGSMEYRSGSEVSGCSSVDNRARSSDSRRARSESVSPLTN